MLQLWDNRHLQAMPLFCLQAASQLPPYEPLKMPAASFFNTNPSQKRTVYLPSYIILKAQAFNPGSMQTMPTSLPSHSPSSSQSSRRNSFPKTGKTNLLLCRLESRVWHPSSLGQRESRRQMQSLGLQNPTIILRKTSYMLTLFPDFHPDWNSLMMQATPIFTSTRSWICMCGLNVSTFST